MGQSPYGTVTVYFASFYDWAIGSNYVKRSWITMQ